MVGGASSDQWYLIGPYQGCHSQSARRSADRRPKHEIVELGFLVLRASTMKRLDGDHFADPLSPAIVQNHGNTANSIYSYINREVLCPVISDTGTGTAVHSRPLFLLLKWYTALL